ncbi:MAG: peptidylprolyl isomerase [Actinomycetota bacterium]
MKTTRKISVAGGLLIAALLSSACGTAFAATAAVVADHQISMRRVSDALDAFVRSAQYKQLIGQQEPAAVKRQFEQSFLSAAIRHDVLTPAAGDLGVVVTQDEVDSRLKQIKAGFPSQDAFVKAMTDQGLSIVQLTDLIRDKVLQDKLRAQVVKSVAPTDKVLKTYYERHKPDYTETRASHILVTKKSLAATLSARLRSASRSQVASLFASLAKKYSTDKGSAAKGGDLGYQKPGQFVPEFEAAEAKLAIGEVSDPVHSRFGWHVIMVTGRKQESFASVRSDIEQILAGTTEQNAWEEWLRKTYAAAHVRVNPVYGAFDVVSQQVIDSSAHVPGTSSERPPVLSSPSPPFPSPVGS